MIDARIMRAKLGALPIVIAKSRFGMLVPSAATMTSASKIAGMHISMSITRMMMLSTKPP